MGHNYDSKNQYLFEKLRQYPKETHLDDPKRRRIVDEIVRVNERLVSSIAYDYMYAFKAPFEDLVSEGLIGLLSAIDKYDHYLGWRFSTYATWWIRQAIRRYGPNQSYGRTISLPSWANAFLASLYCAEQQLIISKTELTVYNIAREMLDHALTSEQHGKSTITSAERELKVRRRFSVENVKRFLLIRDRLENSISINAPVTDGDVRNLTLEEVIPSNQQPVFDTVAKKCDERKLYELMSCLNDRQRRVIMERSGNSDYNDYTMQAVADRMHVTRECVRQIESRALAKLRAKAKTNPYFDTPNSSSKNRVSLAQASGRYGHSIRT